MDWAGIIANELAEEEEMSRLAARFVARVRKRAACLEDEFTLLYDWKRPQRSSPDEEA